MSADVSVRCIVDVYLPVRHDTSTGMRDSKAKLDNVDDHVEHIVVVPEGLEIVLAVIHVLFEFDVDYNDNHNGLQNQSNIIPNRIVLYEDSGKKWNELE